MTIHVKATNTEYVYEPFWSARTVPFPHREELGEHEYQSLEACLEHLMEVYPKDEFIVSKEDGKWAVEIYNDYRE